MNRRGFLFGGATLLAAPAIVRVSVLMPISVPKLIPPPMLDMTPRIGSSFSAELAALTRRAFIPDLIVQMYQESPLLALAAA